MRRPGSFVAARSVPAVRRAILDRPILDRVVDLVAGVAELLADIVTRVADLVGEILAVPLAPGFLAGLFGFAVVLLDLVHLGRSSVLPDPSWARTRATNVEADPSRRTPRGSPPSCTVAAGVTPPATG